jgi:hypothetical protein
MEPNHIYRHTSCLDVDFKCLYVTDSCVGLIPIYRLEGHPTLGKTFVVGSAAYDKPKDMSQWLDVTNLYEE